jgi:hypothetical protein
MKPMEEGRSTSTGEGKTVMLSLEIHMMCVLYWQAAKKGRNPDIAPLIDHWWQTDYIGEE